MCTNSAIAGLSSHWRGASFWSPGKQGGVAIPVNENFQGEILSWKKDTDGRIVSLLVKIDGYKVNSLRIYARTNLTRRKVFFENVHAFFLSADATFTRARPGNFLNYQLAFRFFSLTGHLCWLRDLW